MVEQINMQTIILLGVVVIGIWEFIKKGMEMIKTITTQHDRVKKWDEAAEYISKSREEIVKRYDEKLAELEIKIDENHCDTEAKVQELKAEMFILTKSVNAVLDGLIQQGCNGHVTAAKKELDEFLMTRAYD